MPSDAPPPVDAQQNGDGEQQTDGQEAQVSPVAEELFPNADYLLAHRPPETHSPPPVQLTMPERINLELPETFNLSHSDLKLKSDLNLPFELPRNGISLRIKMDETKKEKFLHLAPVLITAVAAFMTAFVLLKQNDIQKKQAEASTIQAEASKIQAKASDLQAALMEAQNKDTLRNLRITLFNDIVNGDVSQKNAALMTLAENDESIQTVIGQALNFEPKNLHESTADIVSYLFQLEDVYPEKHGTRDRLFTSLLGYLKSQAPRLQEGALRCFIKLQPVLKPEETEKIIALLKEEFQPQSVCESGKVSVMQTVAQFLGHTINAETRELLLNIAVIPDCYEARRQAVISLAENWEKTPAGRDEILDGLKKLKEEVQGELRGVKKAQPHPTLEPLRKALVATISTIEKSKNNEAPRS